MDGMGATKDLTVRGRLKRIEDRTTDQENRYYAGALVYRLDTGEPSGNPMADVWSDDYIETWIGKVEKAESHITKRPYPLFTNTAS